MKKSTTSTPHDAVFKTFLRHPETARDFMEIHLPVSLRQRDLLGLVERIASLLVTGCANDRQLKALFNYLMIQHGHTPRFTTFIRDVVGHVPHTKERLMMLIERIRAADRRKGERQGRQVGLEEGLAEGLEKGLEKGQHVAALRIARQMLADGLDRETVQRFTGLTAEELQDVSH
ncbi:Rpn family recombination-promoting nuclease/putative transposase [Salmonella enterica]|nr:Rpn family recombination-promoting nuclease/putative transposase [Salmonella enterica]EJS2151950.1 Rpn family recombination-promoting nuclease/putative transposase [Salmonella enterica]ELG4026501.1 Rpn family recombination-promoting nuclease/putative transposase [Salmonella enterica]